MNSKTFEREYNDSVKRFIALSKAVKTSGIVSLKNKVEDIDDEFVKLGLRLVIEETPSTFLDKLLSHHISLEKDENSRLLKTIQKEAVLMLQAELETKLLARVLSSYTGIPLSAEIWAALDEGSVQVTAGDDLPRGEDDLDLP